MEPARCLRLHRLVPGNAVADAAVPDVLRPADARPAYRAVDGGGARPHLLRQRLSGRNLALWRRCAAIGPMGCRRQPRPALSAAAQADHPAAGVRDHPRANGRFPGAADQVDRADLDHRLRGIGANLQRHQQRYLRTVQGLWAGGADLFRPMLSADAVCAAARTTSGGSLSREHVAWSNLDGDRKLPVFSVRMPIETIRSCWMLQLSAGGGLLPLRDFKSRTNAGDRLPGALPGRV